MDAVFDPAGITWTRVSPQLVKVRLVTWTLSMILPIIATVVIAIIFLQWWAFLNVAVVVGVYVWVAIVIRRQVPAIGYAEREDDLLIRTGILNRSIVVVPYGRMQLVDVEAGPLDRKFKIAKVTLHTASALSDATVPGLAPEEAARLRDRLASRGQARLAGL
ncbi:PH domain-containing protein [Timonella sp. A28]|uniref:PH domain-containing protein n=1 Tax=Timonella sp. A28 TaxID=3442640 RepID=UPI003EBEB816